MQPAAPHRLPLPHFPHDINVKMSVWDRLSVELVDEVAFFVF